VTNHEELGGTFGITQKTLVRRGAQTLLSGVWTFGVEVIEFQRFL